MNHFGQSELVWCAKRDSIWIMNRNNYSKKYSSSITDEQVYHNRSTHMIHDIQTFRLRSERVEQNEINTDFSFCSAQYQTEKWQPFYKHFRMHEQTHQNAINFEYFDLPASPSIEWTAHKSKCFYVNYAGRVAKKKKKYYLHTKHPVDVNKMWCILSYNYQIDWDFIWIWYENRSEYTTFAFEWVFMPLILSTQTVRL